MSIARIIAIVIGTLLLAALAFLQPLRFLNNIFYDLSFRFSSTPAADSVTVVAIDDESIGKLGAMPWSRGLLSKLVDSINAAGAKSIALDILFPRRPDQAQNDSLAASFERVQSLVLPFKVGRLTEEKTSPVRIIRRDISRYRFVSIVNEERLPGINLFAGADINPSDSQFTNSALYGGFLNVSTSASTQKLREVIHVLRVGSEYYPSLAVAAVAAYRRLAPSDVALDGSGSIMLGGERIPISSYAGSAFINYRRSGIALVSAAELLEGTADRSLLRNRLVFVGVTDPAAGADFFITPISPQYPGVIVWATAALDIMQQSWVRYGGGVGGVANAILLLLLFPGIALVIPSYRRILSILAGSGLVILSISLSIMLLKSQFYFWDPTGHFYGWIVMLLWLAATRAVPSIASVAPLALEPAGFIDETVPQPPKELDFKAQLPQTATMQFVSKTHQPVTGPATGTVGVTEQGTIIEGVTFAQPTPDSLVAFDESMRAIAGGVILRNLGSGGMADVYLVWNPRLEVYRAVKVMKPGLSDSIRERFETEIRIFSKLHHGNIVECYTVGDWHTLPYIEMEYINGIALDDVLRQCGTLTTEQALIIGILVCRALHYAHNQTIFVYGKKYKGIVHRDLKPANIMLCRNGRIKLTDFGIARPGELALNTENSGQIIGTFPYLAPEQIDGSELTGQADVYALGATIYEFITGERAFPQTDANAIMSAKVTGSYKRITPSGSVSKEVVAVIEKALAVKPEERYPSASALQSELERVLRPLIKENGFVHLQGLADRTMQKTSARNDSATKA